jgi:hypothetical protein
MHMPHFDIFKMDRKGNPVWIEAVADLKTAEARLREWAVTLPGEYFAFDQRAHQVVARLQADLEYT